MRSLIRDIICDQDRSLAGAVIRPVLALLSFVYTLIVMFLAWSCRRGFPAVYRAGRPVISVGNITAGGTGKTPIVMMIAARLLARGFKPVVLTRGYRGTDRGSDEARMMTAAIRGLEVIAGPDRVAGARQAQARADVLVLDDGFQQWRFKRDLNILVIDATDPFGNGYLLPRGRLREPLSAMKRADVFVLTRTDLGAAQLEDVRRRIMRVKPRAVIVETVHAPAGVRDLVTGEKHGLDAVRDRVVAVCAIGSPGAFRAMLEREGALLEDEFIFEDHYAYTRADVERIVGVCREKGVTKVLMTAKDGVKIMDVQGGCQGVSFLVVDIEIKVVHGQTEFFSRIDRCVHP